MRTKEQCSLVIFVMLSSFFMLIFIGGQVADHQKAKRIVRDKAFFIVEGKPENYSPMPKEGHRMEKFDIGGEHFEYSDYAVNAPGYNQAASLGGVITPDKYYRITYFKMKDVELSYSNRILKIEIRD